jgi:hypothetical protein
MKTKKNECRVLFLISAISLVFTFFLLFIVNPHSLIPCPDWTTELLSITAVLALIVEVSLFFVFLAKKKNKIREILKPLSNKILVLLSVAFCLFSVVSTVWFFNNVTSEGFYQIEKVEESKENGSFYLFVNNHKIEVSEELYSSIENEEIYHVKFVWNQLFEHTKLLELTPVNYE